MRAHCRWMSAKNSARLATTSSSGVNIRPALETAGDLGHARRTFAGRGLIDGFERVLHTVGREAHRVRKFAVEQQKFGHALGPQIGGVDLAIGFKRGATAEQADPLHVLAGIHGLPGGKFVEIDIEQARGGGGAFDEAAHLDELPAFAVIHGGIGDALHQMRAFENDASENPAAGNSTSPVASMRLIS